MMVIRMMPDVEKFLSLVEQSRGDVLLHMPDGSCCSLKHNQVIQQMLRMMQPGRDGITLSFSDPDDIPPFLWYLIEKAC